MKKRIALLRGINVGGKRKLLMADVKLLFSRLGFVNVVTYIQSGNIVFSTNSKCSSFELANKIEKIILQEYDFFVPVIIRSATEIEQIVRKNPFYGKKNTEITQLHLTFLKDLPAEENLTKINAYDFTPDKFKITEKDVFIYCKQKYHQSKLTNAFFEKNLKTSATTRNWKTVLKILELSKQ